jgi:hypothetical protein
VERRYVGFDIDELVLIWRRYFWAFATGVQIIETLVDVAADWARPVGEADGHSAAIAGAARPASRVTAATTMPGRKSERMGAPRGRCDRSDKSG